MDAFDYKEAMRMPRILGNRDSNYYHVMSRVVNGDFIFGNEEKEFFRSTMRDLEEFLGLRILTYCIMSNHFHILVEVQHYSELNDDILLQRLESFYSPVQFRHILQSYERAKTHADETGNEKWLDEFRTRYTSRMSDLSSFLKELKERFSTWYNRKNNRRGTLWEERFKSVLVENSDHALLTMAAYIDLNPVRAGLAEDPKDYRYCGYSEAVAGKRNAQEGMRILLQTYGQADSWKNIAARYRTYLFCKGDRKGIDPVKTKEVLRQNGELQLHELVRCRIRYFSDGVALGSRRFIEEVFEQNKSCFGKLRRSGARPMDGGDWQGLFNMRNYHRNPVSIPA